MPDPGWTKTYGRITYSYFYGEDAPPYWAVRYGFLKFELDSLPGVPLESVNVCFYQYEQWNTVPYTTVRLIRDPVPMWPESLFTAIGSGQDVTFPDGHQGECWKVQPLTPEGVAAADSCRQAGQPISFGIWLPQSIPAGGRAYGCDSDTVPYLRVVFDVPGTQEPEAAAVTTPALGLEPNPSSGRSVTVIHDPVRHNNARLALRDVLGKTVLTMGLNVSGSTRIDLRGIGPGVYVAILETALPPVSQKLVVVAR